MKDMREEKEEQEKKKSYLRNYIEMLLDGTSSLSSSERNEM